METRVNYIKVLLLFIISVQLQFIQCAPNNTPDSKTPPPPRKLNTKLSDGVSRNVTRVLNQLLRGYDKRIRPNYSGPPVLVGITSKQNIFIKLCLHFVQFGKLSYIF